MRVGDAVAATIDSHHLLFGGMDSSSENPGFHRRLVVRRPHDALPRDAARQCSQHAASRFIAASDADDRGATAKAYDVVHRVPRTPGQDLRRVVLED